MTRLLSGGLCGRQACQASQVAVRNCRARPLLIAVLVSRQEAGGAYSSFLLENRNMRVVGWYYTKGVMRWQRGSRGVTALG